MNGSTIGDARKALESAMPAERESYADALREMLAMMESDRISGDVQAYIRAAIRALGTAIAG